jgi:tetratricopeptide (TPR) repeat protein
MMTNKYTRRYNSFISVALLAVIFLIFSPYPIQADQDWQKLVDEAGLSYEKGEPEKAMGLLKKAVRLTNPDTEARAAVLNNLAIVIEASGDLDGAESLYTKVIGLWARLLGSDHPNVSRTLGNLADLNHRRGQMEEAVEAYQLAIATIDKSIGLDAKQVRLALHTSYAKLLRELGRNSEANAISEKVLKNLK